MRLSLAVPVLALVVAAPALSACEPDRSVATVLLATEAGHWGEIDVPTLRSRVSATCQGCEVEVAVAGDDAAEQERQFAAALDAESDVVVIEPVDPQAAEDLVRRAGDVPVVAWGDFVPGADHFVGAQPGATGRLLGRYVERSLPSGGGRGGASSPRVLVLSDPGNDPAVAALLETALGRFSPAGARLVEVAAADPAEAEREVTARLEQASYALVVAGTDALAAGAAQALDGVEEAPDLLAPGADLTTARRIVTGDQAMSVYEPHRRIATQVADVVVSLLTGGVPSGGEEHEGVESWQFEARTVTLSSLTSTMVHDGAIDLDVLCAGRVRARCAALGLL